MGHLSTLKWMKVHYIFKILSPFQNFQIFEYLTKKYDLEMFGKVKIIKAFAGFELRTYILIGNNAL